jgi:hypothetical protein
LGADSDHPEGNMMRAAPVIYLLLVILIGGCVVIPTPKKVGVRGKITGPALEFLEKGKTHRDEVLLHLGMPSRANHRESKFVYEGSTAWDLCVVNGFGTTPANNCSERRKDFALLLEFDNQGVLSRFAEYRGDEMMTPEHFDLSDAHMEDLDPCDLLGTSCEFEGNLTDSNLYTNDEAGFSIQFPLKWTIRCGRAPLIVNAHKEVYKGLFAIFPSYVLTVRVEIHPVVAGADFLNLDRSSLLSKGACCPVNWTCNWESNLLESEKMLLDGMPALRERYEIKGISQVRHAYQLYRLGPERFGNHPTGSQEFHDYHHLLAYWFVDNDRIFLVSGELSLWFFGEPGLAAKYSAEYPEEVKKGFDKHKETLEEVLRSFHLNDSFVSLGSSE